MLLGAFAGFLEDVSWFQHFPWHNILEEFGITYGVPTGDAAIIRVLLRSLEMGRCRFLRVSMFCCFKVLFDVKCEGCVLGCIGTRRQVCLWHWKGSQWHSGAVKSVLVKFWWGHLMFWDCLDRLISFQAKSAPHALRRFRQLLHFFASISAKTFGVGERKHSWHKWRFTQWHKLLSYTKP